MQLAEIFEQVLQSRQGRSEERVPQLVDALIDAGRRAGATDIHICPREEQTEMRWRVDGVLHSVALLPRELHQQMIARLKVLAGLLTYKTEIPQEGRIAAKEAQHETRLSTFPTMFGEKAVIRLFAGSGKYHRLTELGFPSEVLSTMQALLQETGGVILLTGPAGSGKTTTIYAALREILDKSRGQRSLVSLEDPIEVLVSGVDQSQVHLPAGFTMETGLKALLRQDPDVIMVGEIRDRATAETVFQASLTGHLVLTTFHAGSTSRAISRLSDLGIEPYLLRSGILAVLCQRLYRRLCDCAEWQDVEPSRTSLPVTRTRVPVGCEECQGTGYRGQRLLTELLLPSQEPISQKILDRSDAGQIERAAQSAGTVLLWDRAWQAVRDGQTSLEEILRVLGAWSHPASQFPST